MKFINKSVGLCLLLVLVFQSAAVVPAFARAASARGDKALEQRIRRVENGLLPPFQIKGESAVKMNIAERMKHHKVPGVSVAVINNGRVEWAKGYGETEAGTNRPVTTETLFQAASISKPVAAAVALKMVQDGRLELDEDVNRKLVTWKMPDNEFTKERKVTLRGILSHTAGLGVSGFPGYKADMKTLPTIPQILDGTAPANTKAVRVEELPGTRWSYSGGGITVMQQLVTDVSGKSFPETADEIVFKKTGMKNSTYRQPLPEKLQARAAAAHDENAGVIPGRWHLYPEMAAAGLWTTPTDLARFAVELQQALAGKSRKVLNAETTRQMFTKQIGGWGLGVSLQGEGKTMRFSHGGSNEGFRCQLVAYTETGQGAVVMTNSDNGDQLINEILRSIAAEYGWPDYLAKEKTIVRLDAQNLDKYTGKFQFGTAGEFTVLAEAGKLKLQLGGETKYELLAESETSFFIREMPLTAVFVKDAGGQVVELIINYGGQEFRLKKI